MRSEGRRLGLVLACLLGLFLVLAAAGVWWVGQTSSFVRWALERAVQASKGALEVGTARGSLAGGVAIDRLAWREGGTRVEVAGLSFGWRPEWLLGGELRLRSLRADRVEIELIDEGEPSSEPPPLPTRIGLPLPVGIDRLAIGEFVVRGAGLELPPIRAIRASLRYRAGAWRLPRLSAQAEGWGSLSAEARVAAREPFEVEARAVAQPALADWPRLPPLALAAEGPLAALALRLRMLAPGASGALEEAREAPAWMTAETRLHAFDPTPVRELALLLEGFEPHAIGLPGPRARLTGSLEAMQGEGWQGRLALRNELTGTIDAGGLPLTSLASRFAWREGRLEAGAIEIDEGVIRGRVAVDTRNTQTAFGRSLPAIDADLALTDLDLRRWHGAAPSTSLGGTLALAGSAASFALSDPRSGGLSLAGSIALEGELLRLASLRLGTSAGTLSAAGTAGLQPPHRIDLGGAFQRLQPAQLAAIAGFEPPEAADRLRALTGEWSASGTVQPELALDSRLRLTEGRFDERPLRLDWQGRVARDRLSGLRLTATLGELAARLAGDAGRPGDRLALELRAPSLAALDPALSGSLQAEGELELAGLDEKALAAARVSLHVRGARLAYARPEGEPVSAERVRAGVEGTLGEHRLELEVEKGRPASGSASAHGSLVLGSAKGGAAKHGPAKSGDAKGGDAKGGAKAGEAPWRWAGSVDAFSLRAPIALRLAGPAPLTLEPGAVTLGPAALVDDDARIELERLALRAGRFELAGGARALPLARWGQALGLLPEPERPVGELRLSGRWQLAGSSVDDLDGEASLQLATAGALEGEGAIDLRLDAGRLGGKVDLALPSLAFAEAAIGPEWAIDGRVRVRGDLSGTLREPGLTGRLEGRELTLLQRAMGWRLESGVLDARFDGDRLQLERLRLESAEGALTLTGGLQLDGLDGRFRLLAERLAVPIGPGQRVVVSGDTQIVSSATSLRLTGAMQVDEGLIELRGGSTPTLPDDVVIVSAEEGEAATGEGAKPGAGKASSSKASPAKADAAKDAAAKAAPAKASQAPGAATSAEAGAGAQGFELSAELEIDLGRKLRVRGRGVDALLAGSLTLAGELPEAPRATGTVRVREGVYSAYGQKLVITRGRVIFNGPIDNPALDIVAMRRGPAVEAGVAVTGTVLSPRIRLVSEPDVPDAQKLSWLVLGVAPEEARSGAQVAALQAAAATLFGSSGGGLTGGIAKSLGLDVLTIRSASTTGYDPNFGASFPGLAGTTGQAANANATQDVVAIGKRLGSRVTVTYEQGLRGVWSLLRLQYDLSRRVSVRAQTGTDTAVDLLYGFSFD